MPNIFQRPRMLPIAAMLAACAVPWSVMAQQATLPATLPAGKPKVIVVPLKGPLHYQMTVSEINKIIRGVTIQKPEAVIFVISSPGGSRDLAFSVAEQIADMPTRNIVAYVTGDYGGVFGPAVFPLFACSRVFLAPQNALDLTPVADAGQEHVDSTQGPLTPRQISLLQSWAAQRRLAWGPIRTWLTAADLAPQKESDTFPPAGAPASAPDEPDSAAASRPAAESAASARLGPRALNATRADSIGDILAELGLKGAWVITWPDPVAKTNEQMQHIFQAADELVKQTNAAIGAARDLDPRARRYELRDVSRQYTTKAISGATRPSDARTVYEQTDTLTDHDLFADGGAAWQDSTDRCMVQVRKAMEANRNLARLVARYPEINIDSKELNESHETLAAWSNQLRSERNLRSPP